MMAKSTQSAEVFAEAEDEIQGPGVVEGVSVVVVAVSGHSLAT